MTELEQEPVAYINIEKRRLEWAYDYMSWDAPTVINLPRIPLYTHQRTWVGLTYEEQEEIVLSAHSIRDAINKTDWKLKEKNT
jgi:hypothetical protein